MSASRPHRILIAGPTASGKSALAMRVASLLPAEIISADSRQCYRGLDIGTAKPSPQDLATVPHHNISVLDPTEADSAMGFFRRAGRAADKIESKNRVVLYAGGSTLHLQTLIRPLAPLPPSSPENLTLLESDLRQQGTDALFARLQQVDPAYAGRINPKNPRRILRALDVYMQTGRPFSSYHSDAQTPEKPAGLLVYALHHPRKTLHERIEKRCDEMLAGGLVEETEALLASGLSPDLQAFQTVGYRQVISWLHGEITREQMEKDFKTATRRYAKRQMTWLRRWPFVTWLDGSGGGGDENFAEHPTPDMQPSTPSKREIVTDKLAERIVRDWHEAQEAAGGL